MKLKKGDKVLRVCEGESSFINNEIKIGEVYTVTEVGHSYLEIKGSYRLFNPHYFKVVNTQEQYEKEMSKLVTKLLLS